VTFLVSVADTHVMTQMTNLERLLDPAAASRFWSNIDILGSSDCWLWRGPHGVRERSGHVRVWHQGTRIYAHRLAFLLSGGQVGEGQLVLHSCDVPACCNPSCLRAGSALDNARDRDSRGRRTPRLPRGESHWSAKLSNLDARRIRLARELGVPADDLAQIFGLCRASIYNVLNGVTYAEADAIPTSGCPRRRNAPSDLRHAS
jgi:hypothetical protein